MVWHWAPVSEDSVSEEAVSKSPVVFHKVRRTLLETRGRGIPVRKEQKVY